VRYQKRIDELEEANKKLKEENEELEDRLAAITQLYMNLLKYK
jgi:prefoldin subunit 5